MQSVIYDVAVSIDGFICGPNGDISQFAHEGAPVEDYQTRLQAYATAIMGKATYEFGYRFGMQPGQKPYPHMTTYVYSQSIELPDDNGAQCDVTIVAANWQSHVQELKATSPGPIYLCGGGQFAGSLLTAGMIDLLRLKRAPIILGDGVRLFGDHKFGDHAMSPQLTHVHTKQYNNGYLLQEFRIEPKKKWEG